MTGSNLQAQIEALNEQYAAEIQTAQKYLDQVETKREALRQEIERLRSELDQIETEYQAMEDDVQVLPALQQQSVGTLVVEALTDSQKSLFGRLEDLLQLRQQREELADELPDVTRALAEIERFEESMDQLASLPDSYRESLLAHHEERKEELQPYMELFELERLAMEQPLQLILLMIDNPQESQINWVLPLPSTAEKYPQAVAALLEELSEMLIYTILRLGQDPDWYFAGMDEEDRSWHGFSTQVTLMEYSGKEPPAAHAARVLQAQLDALLSGDQAGLLQGLQIAVEAALIPQDARGWASEQEAAAAGEPQAVAAPQPETAAAPEPQEPAVPLIERSDGWYSDEDVTAWERPLKVTEDSAWNIQGRRLRTALINLVARGHMAENYVEQQFLYQALPSPHKEALSKGIDHLLEHEILQKAGDADGTVETMVAINPQMISHVQDLINRQVDGMWQPIINP